MLFNSDNPILHITAAEHLKWKSGVFNVRPRRYSALAFRISGSAIINACGNEYCINTNDILYLPQGVGYTASYTDTEMLVIHFVTEKDDKFPEIYSFRNPLQIYKAFLNALSIWKSKRPGYEAFTMAQLFTIIGTILEKETEATMPQHFLNAVSFINSNYKDAALCIGSVCEKSGINETLFRQLFKKHYLKTPIEYITELRIEHARNLISGGESVENAAYESGFNDPKYFSRVVKRKCGCTPRSFKSYGK
ncbi:MAG: helix-turn-helix transcriptional regulator [Clostridia bacterium]|nr:helix-turn-helix transcriptional regulator [Clostridia bacterium]